MTSDRCSYVELDNGVTIRVRGTVQVDERTREVMQAIADRITELWCPAMSEIPIRGPVKGRTYPCGRRRGHTAPTAGLAAPASSPPGRTPPMPDTTARPLVRGRRSENARVDTLSSHGLVMIALLGVEGHTATFVPFTPDEARRLGIALVCAADLADETEPPAPPAQGRRTLIGAGKLTAGHLMWWRTTSARVANEARAVS